MNFENFEELAMESAEILFNFPEIALESIESDKLRIDKFESRLQNLDEGSTNYNHLKMMLANMYRNMINAACSNGFSKDKIQEYVKKYLEYFDFNNASSYSDIIDTLSLIIVFDINDIFIAKLPYNDSLISTLCEYISSGKIKSLKKYSLNFHNEYHMFMDVLCNKVTCDDLISYINNDWYGSNNDMYWYNSHKSSQDTYYGYVCWIGAAVLKIMKCPNNKIRNCKYVPRNII